MSSIWKPAVFQGIGKKRDYFEGWYFKSVDKEEKNAYAIIPGVSITGDESASHAFIMIFDARGHKLYYNRYPLSEFRANSDKFEISIGRCFFSLENIRLNIENKENKIFADLKFSDIHPWPVTLFSPGVMGWYAFIPKMECYHGVLSFDHDIEGCIEINGDKKDLTGGKGYIEKDWGSSMPSSWIWMQTNHFDDDSVSLFGSIAKIPWLSKYFTGYIFGLFLKGRVYKFTTYNGSKVKKLDVNDKKIIIHIEDKKYRLEIEADREEGVDLPAPKLGEMTSKVNESLKSNINVKLYKKNSGSLDIIFSGMGRNAGLEFVGNVDELLKGFRP
jgi:hypothetical protein